jgi:Spy/CpxP family protein refolding chaperone
MKMKNITLTKGIVILAAIATLGLVATAYAGWGDGYGHRGRGWHHMGWGGPGQGGYDLDLTDEQRQAMEQQRRAFFEDTKDLRQNLYVKELELRSELAKADADAQKAAAIQKDISNLEAELDQKRLDHIVKMKKVNPDAGRGYMAGGRGRGGMMGYGPGAGRGPGGGYCWD